MDNDTAEASFPQLNNNLKSHKYRFEYIIGILNKSNLFNLNFREDVMYLKLVNGWIMIKTKF